MKVKLVVLAVAVMLVASACTLRETKEYEVVTGAGWPSGGYVDMRMKEATNSAIAVSLFRDLCNWTPQCVGNWLYQNTKVEGWGAAEWYGGVLQYNNLYNSLVPVYRSIAQPGRFWGDLPWYYEAPVCLTLRKSWTLTTDWIETGQCGAFH